MDDKKIELNGKINGLLGVIPPSVPHADELGNLVNVMRNNSEKWVSSSIASMDMKQFEKLYEAYWNCSYSDVSRVSEAIVKDTIPLYQKFNDIIVQANNAIKVANNAKGLMEALLTHAYLCEFGGKVNVNHSAFEELMEQKLKKIEKEKDAHEQHRLHLQKMVEMKLPQEVLRKFATEMGVSLDDVIVNMAVDEDL